MVEPFDVLAGGLLVLILAGLLVMAVWVYRDARRTGVDHPFLWGLLTFISGIAGVFLYIAVEKLGLLERART